MLCNKSKQQEQSCLPNLWNDLKTKQNDGELRKKEFFSHRSRSQKVPFNPQMTHSLWVQYFLGKNYKKTNKHSWILYIPKQWSWSFRQQKSFDSINITLTSDMPSNIHLYQIPVRWFSPLLWTRKGKLSTEPWLFFWKAPPKTKVEAAVIVYIVL